MSNLVNTIAVQQQIADVRYERVIDALETINAKLRAAGQAASATDRWSAYLEMEHAEALQDDEIETDALAEAAMDERAESLAAR